MVDDHVFIVISTTAEVAFIRYQYCSSSRCMRSCIMHHVILMWFLLWLFCMDVRGAITYVFKWPRCYKDTHIFPKIY